MTTTTDGNPWIEIHFPEHMDYSAAAQSRYPALVVRAIQAGSTTVRLPLPRRSQEASQVLVALPGARVVRYFRDPNDPYQDCPWDHIGASCRCRTSCAD